MAKLIHLRSVLERTGLSKSTLYRLLGEGSFPQPVKLTGLRRVAWSDEEVDGWINAKLKERHQ